MVPLEVIQRERENVLAHNLSTDIYLTYCEYLKQKYNIGISSEEILKRRWDISHQYLCNRIDYKKNADVLLHKLKELGFILVLATVTTQVQLDIYEKINQNIISKADLLSTFDLILSKEHITHKKPHPEVYLKVLEYYHVSPDECLVFEDSLLGVEAAKEAGIEVVTVYDSYSDNDRDKINLITDYSIPEYEQFLSFLHKKK
jgi:beta-phosphoglucomutase-like phosphatase (HAD superfamily)